MQEEWVERLTQQINQLNNKLNDQEKAMLILSGKVEEVSKAVTDMQLTLKSELLDPKNGMIALVLSHDRYINGLKEERVVDMVKESHASIKAQKKVMWLVIAAVIASLAPYLMKRI
ncbi:hypothetical protein KDA08_02860 [Candidatus Saccharibacteria bacterium]|nr:hypothetical protein [Candidatus Saccharibacteria bacterium]